MMKKLYFLFILLFTFLILLGKAESATYYVNALTGSNSNSSAQASNIASPWQTVQYAINNAAVINGDNIVVSAGTYSGFTLTKRLNIIGVWKGSTPTINTVFNTTVTLSAAGGNSSTRMVLKNLRVAVVTGDAIDMRSSFVTLENVFATATTSAALNGLRVNSENLQDLLIESCNFENNFYSGIYFPTFSSLNGFVMKNSRVSGNGYFGITAFQRRVDPTMIENVFISHCAFTDNNPSNQTQGHTIYMEKLKNSRFENITITMAAGNDKIGININLLSRTDYENIKILNSRVIRATPGSGIWIQARNDLFDPAAALTDVELKGLTFQNCDTNIAFNRQVNNMIVDKCDLSTYLTYGLVNFTDQGGTINASNNKWKNGDTPDTTVISGGLLVTGSNIISFMPSTSGIFIGMGIKGPGIAPGTVVAGRSPNTISMSSNALLDGFIPQIGFAFGFATSTDIVRTSLNFVNFSSVLPNSIINNLNVSFPDLPSAILGTAAGGTIYNIPFGNISGTINVDRDLTLISPGSGFLSPGSLTTFDNLSVINCTMTMGSDFSVSGNLSSSRINIERNNTLIINGAMVDTYGTTGSEIVGGNESDIFIGGVSATLGLPRIINGLRTLQLNRASGVSLLFDLNLSRLLFLQNGLMMPGNSNLSVGPFASVFNPFPTASYVSTTGSGEFRKFFNPNSITAFNFTIGNAGYTPVLVFFSSWSLTPGAYLSSNVLNIKHPFNNCTTDYLNRDWGLQTSGFTSFQTNNTFNYLNSDVVGTETSIFGAMWNGTIWTTFLPVNAATNQFKINGLTAYGEFTGGGEFCIGDFNTKVNVKVILQGAFTGGSMRTDLLDEGIIPLSQPYALSQYSYSGTESVGAIPAGVVDWVYIELRSTSSGAAVTNGKRAAFLKSDGSIVELDGVSPVKVIVVPGNYFIVIGHRNHLPVMSTTSQTLSVSSVLYDFTTGTSKYFGNQAANLGGGVFGAYAGDANKSFIISASDYTVVTANLGLINYNQADLNLSAIVSSSDYSLVSANLGKTSQVPNYD